jgi:hypothetical protein
MIPARALPAVKPERPGALAAAQARTDQAEGRPLRLADALSAVAVQRFHSDEIPLSIAAILDSRRATFTQAPGVASRGAGGSQP